MFVASRKAWDTGKAPPTSTKKKGQSSLLVTEAKALVEMVRTSDRYKYLSKMLCDSSTHPPTTCHCSTSRQETRRTDGGELRKTELWESLRPWTTLPGLEAEEEAWPRTLNVWGYVSGHTVLGTFVRDSWDMVGINVEPWFPWVSWRSHRVAGRPIKAKDPSAVAWEEWGPGKWKTENLERLELSITVLKWAIAQKLSHRKIKF